MSGFKYISVVLLVVPVILINGYSIPEVTVQALKNGEFRVYIPDTRGLKSFSVHARINNKISFLEAGEFLADIKEKSGDFWIARFPNANIKAGDTVYIRVEADVDNLRFQKEGINYTITGALDSYPKLESKCVIASTVFDGGKEACIGEVIINEQFQGAKIDTSRWLVEHWIPTYNQPELIFNSFQNRDDTRFIRDRILYLKPIALENKKDVSGTLDLNNGCTSEIDQECKLRARTTEYLPPTRSAKITSKISFKYGKVDIKAKLPAGEWIFPIIQLEKKARKREEKFPKVWIAYSRGNDVLRRSDQTDIGSRLLFGGIVRQAAEPGRSEFLSTKRGSNPFNSQFRVYTVEWLPGKMTFKVDNEEYYSIDYSKLGDIDIRGGDAVGSALFQTEYVITLGTGVGGHVDFPDGLTSGNHPKPWQNTERKYLINFYEKRQEWASTWKGDTAALQVEYVKVTAL